eukprot:4097804-Amphidinium_carterae.2
MDTGLFDSSGTGVPKAWGASKSGGAIFPVAALCGALGFLSIVLTTFRTGNDSLLPSTKCFFLSWQ